MKDLKQRVYEYVQEQGECITGEAQKAFPEVHERTVYDALASLRSAGLLTGTTFSTGRARSTLWRPIMPWSVEAASPERMPCHECNAPRREASPLYAEIGGQNRPVCSMCKARIKGRFPGNGQPKFIRGARNQPRKCRECGVPTVARSYCTDCVAKNARRVRQMGIGGHHI